jgi:hypothetical protein
MYVVGSKIRVTSSTSSRHTRQFILSSRCLFGQNLHVSPIESIANRAISEKNFNFKIPPQDRIKFCTSFVGTLEKFSRFNAQGLVTLFELMRKFDIQLDEAFVLLLLKMCTQNKSLDSGYLVWKVCMAHNLTFSLCSISKQQSFLIPLE